MFKTLISTAIIATTFVAAVQAQQPANKPAIATIKGVQNGDNLCYVRAVGTNGRVYQNLGATFDICSNSKAYLNRKVKLTYGRVKVNDCQSAEPCGKSRLVTVITGMRRVR